MPTSVISFYQPKFGQIHCPFFSNMSIPRHRTPHKGKAAAARCCQRRMDAKLGEHDRNYYTLLGVSIDSTSQQIKEAYRKLQKKYHPDIAGQKGHDRALLMNEAYKVLMSGDMRRQYNASIGWFQNSFGNDASGVDYSVWNGPLRPQALFVDQNACIGCRECVYHARNTFTMDESLGCARVKVQYGDDETEIQVSVDLCPVNCIYWVDAEELQVLEYLIQPHPKKGYGIYGQGWERPTNVFMAAEAFKKQLKQQAANRQK
ncbi:chaperone protein dnaJ C76, chloroplastic-like [Coffea arabica]|uniref:Chaperone protein dnaJ C76, chloroplastic-like n=1 Tax=Coffea arabica TaxID=13443 RepID=A0ABM4V4X2_COFAR